MKNDKLLIAAAFAAGASLPPYFYDKAPPQPSPFAAYAPVTFENFAAAMLRGVECKIEGHGQLFAGSMVKAMGIGQARKPEHHCTLLPTAETIVKRGSTTGRAIAPLQPAAPDVLPTPAEQPMKRPNRFRETMFGSIKKSTLAA